ncbi:uncharacterized protein BX663DRAFT_526222 [Cokeromyces recurvatus]|uniref:uncharacterized protein n=1 Tax=Cokeromyces recurvatus TaxID=90255 RepID=UPI00221ECFEF|nr:uncharacterized protein BX663DRAFT_526222 [Cokeromyces recurvatus]KAI7898101.1 hypothetical protein BX663DRAFT_526222 [Cokeromyces recurvatus]
MKGSLLNKWLCFCLIFISCVIVDARPANGLAKRQAIDNNDINILHHTTSTKSITTTTATTTVTTATSTPNKDEHDENNNTNNDSTIITAGSTEWYVAVYGTESGISPQMASLGAVLIVFGLFLCSMGFRLSKFMFFVMGLLTFGSITWIVLANCKPEAGYSRDSITMIVVPVGVGVIGGLVYYFIWSLAMYLIGAFGGFLFATFICCWKDDFLIINIIGRYCFIGGFALVCAIIVYFAIRPVMLLTTSFVGAYIFMFGVDCLARTGFIAGPEALYNHNPRNLVQYQLGTKIYVLLAMIIFMFLMSVIWQYIFNKAIEFGLHVAAAIKGKQAHEEFHEHQDELPEQRDMPEQASVHPPTSTHH